MLTGALVAGLGAYAAAAPKIAFDSETFEWGTAYQGSKVTHTFKFRNEGDETLRISEVKSSCGCTVPKDWPESVEPGKGGEITATFDTGRRKGRNQTSISVNSNDPERAGVRLIMQGNIEDFIEFRPIQGVSFDGIEMNTGAERTVEFYPTGEHKFEVKEIKNGNDDISVTYEKSRNESGVAGYRLIVTLREKALPGALQDYVRINGILNGSEELEVGFPVRGRVLGKISVSPERLFFRRAGVSPESAEILLSRVDGQPLKVRKIRSDRSEIKGEIIGEGDGKTVRIRFTADFGPSTQNRGLLAGNIRILTDSDDQKEVALPYFANFPQVMKIETGQGQPK